MSERLTLAEACQRLDMSRERVLRQVEKGGIAAINIGTDRVRKLIFDAGELERFLVEGPTKPEATYKKKPVGIKQYVTLEQVEAMRQRLGLD